MKLKTIIMIALASVAMVGCGKSENKKDADNINKAFNTGDAYAESGAKLFLETKKDDENGRLSKTALIQNYSEAKNQLAAAKSQYQRGLDIHNGNRDGVKLQGSEGIYTKMQQIDVIVSRIDTRVKELKQQTRKAS